MKQENGNMFIQEDLTSNNAQVNIPQQAIPGIVSATGESVETLHCARCGAEMRQGARYCMKCGNLNYDHQENKGMKQSVIDNIKYKDYAGGLETAMTNGIEIPDEVRSFPYRSCLVTNIILFIISISLIGAAGYFSERLTLQLGIVMGVVTLITFILSYAYQRMLIKANANWWSVFIPFYNLYTYFKVALDNGGLFWLLFIPGIGLIVGIVAAYKLGKKFYKNGWLMVFFPFIMIPLIGFDKNVIYRDDREVSLKKYSSRLTLDGTKRSKAEKAYRLKKGILSFISFVAFFGFIYYFRDYARAICEVFYQMVLDQIEYWK